MDQEYLTIKYRWYRLGHLTPVCTVVAFWTPLFLLSGHSLTIGSSVGDLTKNLFMRSQASGSGTTVATNQKDNVNTPLQAQVDFLQHFANFAIQAGHKICPQLDVPNSFFDTFIFSAEPKWQKCARGSESQKDDANIYLQTQVGYLQHPLKRSGVQFLLTQKRSTFLVFAQRSPLGRAKTHAAMETLPPNLRGSVEDEKLEESPKALSPFSSKFTPQTDVTTLYFVEMQLSSKFAFLYILVGRDTYTKTGHTYLTKVEKTKINIQIGIVTSGPNKTGSQALVEVRKKLRKAEVCTNSESNFCYIFSPLRNIWLHLKIRQDQAKIKFPKDSHAALRSIKNIALVVQNSEFRRLCVIQGLSQHLNFSAQFSNLVLGNLDF
ncbi:hypothetical protein T439DRAFT_365042 [Meredithblackwellia eburnea MCA 4105]